MTRQDGNSKLFEIEDRYEKRIREIFKDLIREGLNQGQMAERLKVSRVTVNKWMTGLGFEADVTYREVA